MSEHVALLRQTAQIAPLVAAVFDVFHLAAVDELRRLQQRANKPARNSLTLQLLLLFVQPK